MKCVRCEKDATTLAGSGLVVPDWWQVCDEHVSYFNPAWMPRWWFYTSIVLAAAVMALVVIMLVK